MKIKEFLLQNKMRIAVVAICVLTVAIIGIGVGEYLKKVGIDAELSDSLSGENDVNVIFVHVKGAVNNPGLYELRRGDRVFQAVEAAGGLLDGVDPEDINLAEYVEDGQEIYIINRSDAEENDDGRININTASQYELMSLPGVGEATAKRIITYREKNGSFTNIEGIKKISGISTKKFNELKDYIKVE